MVLAIPAGMLLGHTGVAATVVLSNVSRAVPTLALLTIFAVTLIGFGPTATTIARRLRLPADPDQHLRGVPRGGPRRRRGVARHGLQRVAGRAAGRLPLASPLLMTGVRTAAVQVVATATLAALVAGGGLGRIITLGFRQQDYGAVLAGAILVAVAILTGWCSPRRPGRSRPASAGLPFLRPPSARTADPALAAPPL